MDLLQLHGFETNRGKLASDDNVPERSAAEAGDKPSDAQRSRACFRSCQRNCMYPPVCGDCKHWMGDAECASWGNFVFKEPTRARARTATQHQMRSPCGALMGLTGRFSSREKKAANLRSDRLHLHEPPASLQSIWFSTRRAKEHVAAILGWGSETGSRVLPLEGPFESRLSSGSNPHSAAI